MFHIAFVIQVTSVLNKLLVVQGQEGEKTFIYSEVTCSSTTTTVFYMRDNKLDDFKGPELIECEI